MSGRQDVVAAPGGPSGEPWVGDFDGDPPYSTVVRTIAAALDDEGKHLTPITLGGLRIRAVRMGAVTRYFVPAGRVAAGRLQREAQP